MIGFDGTEPDVDWQVKQLGSAAAIISGTDAIVLRNSLRDAPVYPSTMTVRFHIASSQVGAFSRMIEWTAKRAGFYSAVISDTGTGYMWAHFEPINSVANWKIFHDDLRDKASRCGGSFILCRLPTGLASLGLDVWSPVLGDVTLMKRIKEHMDPLNMWSPGRGYARI